MSAVVVIIRVDHTPGQLRAFAVTSEEPAQTRAGDRDGPGGELAAARRAGMDRQTLRDWVHWYNASGVEGLVSGKAPGAAPKLTQTQMAEPKHSGLHAGDESI